MSLVTNWYILRVVVQFILPILLLVGREYHRRLLQSGEVMVFIGTHRGMTLIIPPRLILNIH